MKHLKWCWVAAIAIAMTAGSSLTASDFRPSDVNKDASWYLHVDLDAVRQSDYLKDIDALGDSFEEVGIPMVPYTWLRQRYGIERGDIHAVTLYGAGEGKQNQVALLYADFSKEKVVDVVKDQPEFRTSQHGEHKLYSWSAKDKKRKTDNYPHDVTLAVSDDVAIFAASESHAKQALDLLQSESPSFDQNEGLLAMKIDGVSESVIQGACTKAKKFGDAPLLGQLLASIERTAFVAGESGEGIYLNLAMDAKDADSARQTEQLLMGLHAAAQLSGAQADRNNNAEKQSVMSKLQQAFNVSSERDESTLLFRFEAKGEELSEAMVSLQKAIQERREQRRKEHKVAKPAVDIEVETSTEVKPQKNQVEPQKKAEPVKRVPSVDESPQTSPRPRPSAVPQR